MIDFLMISTRMTNKGMFEIYPKFKIMNSSDLMIRGGDFYAIWVEELGLWSTDEQDVIRIIDKELDKFAEENRQKYGDHVRIKYMWDSESGVIDMWHKYCQRQLRDNFHSLDDTLIFSNTQTTKKDYASKKLNYPLEAGDLSAYEKIMSTLYTPEERHKIEWAIGSIVAGESDKLQKFLVLYGDPGSGKGTVLNIVQQLFEGYYSVFDAKALGSSSNSFALEAFKSNPLVAIQFDGDLSRIEDNTRLNSLVSHEYMTVNEKFKSAYTTKFKCFLFMGTNKPVKITDAKSGLLRRLIDVTPSGKKLSKKDYDLATKQIEFELGAIAYHCKYIYLNNPNKYDDYTPLNMLEASNDFYNFIVDSYHIFKKEDGVSFKAAWEMYKAYCDEANVQYKAPQRVFKEELKNYFDEYTDRFRAEDDTRIRSYYKGFKSWKIDGIKQPKKEEPKAYTIQFEDIESIFDKECAGCPAQEAGTNDKPVQKWVNVATNLSQLDTSKVHYVKVPENHIVIDFDIPDENGHKSFERNLEEANKWPPTYAELSKSGGGIHLHYIYTGDVNQLSRVYGDHIEIKIFTGGSSLRRKLSKCNNLPIATISSGLPTKGERKMVNFESIKSEKAIRTMLRKNLNKEIHPGTKPSVDFIYKILEDAYSDGLNYDVTDMRPAILSFAAGSTNQSDYCIKLVNKMKFKSEEVSNATADDGSPIIFYDVEVFPNLFLVNWKVQGEGKHVVRMINPTPAEIEELMQHKLVGFNCRRYDNHILWARMMGYTNAQLYNLSQRIINQSPNCFFSEAYNVSYTDVYDFSAKKQSLKKWEIELGIHHQELGLPWDQPVPEELWLKVAEYCDNDVIATEAVFNKLQADFLARQILADVAGMTPNDTTNTLTTKIIFGNNRKPQGSFNYRNMGNTDYALPFNEFDDPFVIFDSQNRPIFPGYEYKHGKSTYRGEEVGEGGYVYSEPGIYGNVALLDVQSMHPASIIAEQLFGDEYTKRFQEIRDARVAIKHNDFDSAKEMLGGALAKYLDDESTAADLAQALKIAINSVYGLTSASFDNPFHDPRNIDNIVAKRGALFMINLKYAVQAQGFTVAHIKTDSIKIPDATPEIIQFVMDFGKKYGYTFEHEATYEKMCLVNKAVYIAKYKDGKKAGQWTATGEQFQVPYVFKKLFTGESIEFEDMCETMSVTTALHLDMNENLPDVSEYEKEKDKLWKIINSPERINENMKTECDRIEELTSLIEEGHKYRFIGKVGSFCPIKPGCGGGVLVREGKDKAGNIKYSAATGSKGYRWLEAEMVRELGKEDCIDRSFYDNLVTEAAKTISVYGDLEWFRSDAPYFGPEFIDSKPTYEETEPFV